MECIAKAKSKHKQKQKGIHNQQVLCTAYNANNNTQNEKKKKTHKEWIERGEAPTANRSPDPTHSSQLIGFDVWHNKQHKFSLI